MSWVGGLLFETVFDYNQKFLKGGKQGISLCWNSTDPNHSKPSAGVGFGFVLFVSLREMVGYESV